jgi:hypothetical protein
VVETFIETSSAEASTSKTETPAAAEPALPRFPLDLQPSMELQALEEENKKMMAERQREKTMFEEFKTITGAGIHHKQLEEETKLASESESTPAEQSPVTPRVASDYNPALVALQVQNTKLIQEREKQDLVYEEYRAQTRKLKKLEDRATKAKGGGHQAPTPV